jgi:RNA polymerase sigma factor (sigma-70 family)
VILHILQILFLDLNSPLARPAKIACVEGENIDRKGQVKEQAMENEERGERAAVAEQAAAAHHRLDEELTDLAVRGDHQAFTDLVERHRAMIRRVARNYFDQPQDIDEMAQLSVVKAWFAIETYRNGNAFSFAAWMARITTNSCYDELRRRLRRRESAFSQLNENDTASVLERRAATPQDRSVETRVILRDLTEKLLKMLEPDDRKILLMLKSENYSVAEIASRVGWTESKVKMRVHRSRSRLLHGSQRLMTR